MPSYYLAIDAGASSGRHILGSVRDGKYFLATGTGKYFKNVQYDPDRNLGLLRVTDNGRTARLGVWSQRGIYGAGADLNETFGLIETAEKAAGIYMKIARLPLKTTIADDETWQPAHHFKVTPREGFLSEE